jgi:hypothetical protein
VHKKQRTREAYEGRVRIFRFHVIVFSNAFHHLSTIPFASRTLGSSHRLLRAERWRLIAHPVSFDAIPFNIDAFMTFFFASSERPVALVGP